MWRFCSCWWLRFWPWGALKKKKTCFRSHQLATQQRIYLKGSNGRFRQRLSLSPLGFGSLCFSESTKLLHDGCKTDPIIGLLVSLHKPYCFLSISSLLVLLLCSGHLCEGAGVWCGPEGSPPRPALWGADSSSTRSSSNSSSCRERSAFFLSFSSSVN